MFLANAHESFMKLNGFLYFETHHVIQQKTSQKCQLNKKIIEDPRNKVYLCPTCHRKIHFSNKYLAFISYILNKSVFINYVHVNCFYMNTRLMIS